MRRSMNFRLLSLTVLGASIAAFMGSVASTGCAAPLDVNRETIVYSPDYAVYKELVDPFLNRRCGTLDCHGQAGRALRNYGTRGLRVFTPDSGLQPGFGATTEEEHQLNYQSLVGVEPEMFARVVAEGGANPERLLILEKALAKGCDNGRNPYLCHKGGKVLAQGDSGYRCLVAWLKTRPGSVKPADFAEAKDCQSAELWQ